MKRGAPSHPKMKALARTLDVPLAMAVGMMEMLWHFAGQYAPAGDIGRFDDEHIEEECGWTQWKRHRSGSFIEAAVKTGWIERNEEHRLLVHDWPEHCDDAIHMRLARAREYFSDGSAPKLARLPKVEKDAAAQFYASPLLATPLKHGVRTANVSRDASLSPALAPPKPRPIKAVAAATAFPAAAAAIRERFPATGDKLIDEIVCRAITEWPTLEDHELVKVLQAATRPDQRSAGLYKDTVPEVVKSWR